MLKRIVAAALMLSLGWAGLAITQDRGPAAKDAERIAEMVKGLGSAKFVERERAKKELEAIGPAALDALRKAAKDENLETAKRAQELVRKIEDRILTADLLNPKRVRLNLKDKPVLEAVDELARLSGYPLNVVGDRASVASKKITLDTGEVTFFEALDQLCAKAGLDEQITAPSPGPIYRTRPPVLRPRIIKPALPPAVLPVPVPAPAPALPPAGGLKPKALDVAFIADEPVPADKPADKPAPPVAPKVIAIKAAVGGVVVAAPVPVPGAAGGFGGVAPGTAAPGQIQLLPGTPKKVPTAYVGSVRLRAFSGKMLPADVAKKDDLPIAIEATGEPRLHGLRLVGKPIIHKAIDEHGQELTVSNEEPKMDPVDPAGAVRGVMIWGPGMMTSPATRQQTVRFQKGAKASRVLKELTGTLTAETEIPNEILVKVDNILKASGTTAKGGTGSITVHSVDALADGTFQVKMSIENMQGNPLGGGFGGGIVINGGVVIVGPGGRMVVGGPGGGNNGLPDLVDAKGAKLQFGGVTAMRTNINNGQVNQEATVLYRPAAGTGEPASLVLFGNRTVNFQIPFTFRDVPLE